MIIILDILSTGNLFYRSLFWEKVHHRDQADCTLWLITSKFRNSSTLHWGLRKMSTFDLYKWNEMKWEELHGPYKVTANENTGYLLQSMSLISWCNYGTLNGSSAIFPCIIDQRTLFHVPTRFLLVERWLSLPIWKFLQRISIYVRVLTLHHATTSVCDVVNDFGSSEILKLSWPLDLEK